MSDEELAILLRNLATWEDNVSTSAARVKRVREDLAHSEECHALDTQKRDALRVLVTAELRARTPAEPAPQHSPDVQQEDRQQEAQAIPEGFVAWGGGECPLAVGAVYDSVFGDGSRSFSSVIYSRANIGQRWQRKVPGTISAGDIIAYREVPAPEETAKDGELTASILTSVTDSVLSETNNQQEDSLKGEWDGWNPYPEARDLPLERNGCWLEERFDHEAYRWMYRYRPADASTTDPAKPAPVSSTDAGPVELQGEQPKSPEPVGEDA